MLLPSVVCPSRPVSGVLWAFHVTTFTASHLSLLCLTKVEKMFGGSCFLYSETLFRGSQAFC